MRVYQCYSNGCGKGLITEMQEWGPCPKCGGMKWRKLRYVSYWKMLRVLKLSRFQLLVPPEGSWIEKLLFLYMKDEAEDKEGHNKYSREAQHDRSKVQDR
jgi:hypothetical protein